MKAGIVGAGALGSLFAHMFQRAGISFAMYEKDKNIADEILAEGLTLTEGERSETIHPAISAGPGILADADVIILFVKSYSTGDAVASIRQSISESSVIVSLQNGLGNYEAISKYIPSDRIVYGTTTVGATKTGRSSVAFGGKGEVTIGGGSPDSVETVDSLFEKTGFRVNRIFNPGIAVWKKAVVNAGINPIASILGITNGEILDNPFAMKLQESAVREAVSAANAAGMAIDFDTMLKEVREICAKTSANVCSMLQDIRNRRRTEIDSINGAIIETAAKSGVSTPVNETLYLLVKGLEAKK